MRNLVRLLLILGFRVAFWTLITSNFDLSNIMLGFVLSCLIPLGSFRSLKIKSFFSSLGFVIKLVPNMLIETWQIIRIKHPIDAYAKVPMCTSR